MKVPASVQEAYSKFITEIETDIFSFNDIVRYIERWRGKKIRFEFDSSMPPGLTGYCIALKDCDLVCTLKGSGQVHGLYVRLHEISHLMLNHIEKFPDGRRTPTYAVFMRRCRDYKDGFFQQRLHGVLSEESLELDAEILARILIAGIKRHQESTPRIINLIHG
jgi:hypothetical protein